MTQQHLGSLFAGTTGLGAITLLDAQQSGVSIAEAVSNPSDTISTISKVVITLLSILPSIFSLFKKKK